MNNILSTNYNEFGFLEPNLRVPGSIIAWMEGCMYHEKAGYFGFSCIRASFLLDLVL